MSDEEKGFVIKDRRMFSDGKSQKEDKEKVKKASAGKAPEEPAASPNNNVKDATGDDGGVEETLLPEVNFPTFIMSLNASALLNLGIIEDPSTGQSAKNLPMAKQTIDILSMLEEKTRGNLTKDEAEILKNILYDLRIAYVRERQ
jgi:hypothetical protein